MSDALAAAVARNAAHPGHGRPVLVGFSGGLDSAVLLQLLASDTASRTAGLRAIHVHHGLQPQADDWATHCECVCAALGIPLRVVRARVERSSGLGLEGAARDARHRAFEHALASDEVLALAHHRDDQAETFLLRALRGSGVDGLASMRGWRAFAQGALWRPLLETPRDALQAYAAANGMHWIEDPSNLDGGLDRGFLRTQVLPLLRARWPHAEAMLARSAALATEATDLLLEEDVAALAGAGDGATLRLPALRALSPARRARVLRLWIAALDLPPLPAQGIARIESDLLQARPDANPRFEWRHARVQRWRDLLHAGRIPAPLQPDWVRGWDGAAALELPSGDRLELLGASGFGETLRVHWRRGGERLRLPGRAHTHALKQVLQDAAVPPWLRDCLPLLSRGESVLAAGDRIVSAEMSEWLATRAARLHWTTLA